MAEATYITVKIIDSNSFTLRELRIATDSPIPASLYAMATLRAAFGGGEAVEEIPQDGLRK